MRVAVEQNLHVAEFESERGDVRLDLRRGFDIAAIDHDVAGWRRDEKRRDFLRAHVIDVADDFEWRHRLVPRAAFRIGLRENFAALSAENARPTPSRGVTVATDRFLSILPLPWLAGF